METTRREFNRAHAFRAWLPRQRVAEVMQQQVEAIRYPNFKSSIRDRAYSGVRAPAPGLTYYPLTTTEAGFQRRRPWLRLRSCTTPFQLRKGAGGRYCVRCGS
jgi:hypothetical protein